MTEIKQIGFCNLAMQGKFSKRWPCYGRIGNWCLTPPPDAVNRKPLLDSNWFSVTHQPTGLRAGDLRKDDPGLMKKLLKYHDMFGKAATVSGVMRKYRKLSARQKKWINDQVAWKIT